MDASLQTDREIFARTISATLDVEPARALFELFDLIAVLRYEEAENTGTLALCAPGSTAPNLTVRFESPFDLEDARCTRKYLHISNERLWLVSDCSSVFGFARASDPGDCLYTVAFQASGGWELRSLGTPALRVASPRERRLLRTLNEEQLRRELHATFSGLCEDRASRLCAIAASAARQPAGTNVLISRDARAEAHRLCPQCTVIDPVPLSPALVERFTSIDGTLIVDTDGVCHAIGAILDGSVSPRGERSRGGRYNSALMYLDTTRIPSVIVVVSSDGTVDIVTPGRRVPGG
jgi:hypothetical protein